LRNQRLLTTQHPAGTCIRDYAREGLGNHGEDEGRNTQFPRQEADYRSSQFREASNTYSVFIVQRGNAGAYPSRSDAHFKLVRRALLFIRFTVPRTLPPLSFAGVISLSQRLTLSPRADGRDPPHFSLSLSRSFLVQTAHTVQVSWSSLSVLSQTVSCLTASG
jgi:hypothetical protein